MTELISKPAFSIGLTFLCAMPLCAQSAEKRASDAHWDSLVNANRVADSIALEERLVAGKIAAAQRLRSQQLAAKAAVFTDSLSIAERREFIVAEGKKHGWPATKVRDVVKNKVWVGMTAYQARLSWGEPSSINTTLTASGNREQWVYGKDYLYVSGNRVRAIQTSR